MIDLSELTEGTLKSDFSRVPRKSLTLKEHRQLGRKFRLKRASTGLAFIAPVFIFFILFMLIPVVWVVWLSFRSGGLFGPTEFVGLKNWVAVFHDKTALQSIKNAGLYSVMAIPGMLVIGMILALFFMNIKRGGALLRAGIYIPVLTPTVVVGLMWVFMVHPDFGALNLIVRTFGGKPLNFLGSTSLALPTVAMVEVWRGIGFWCVYFLAALSGLPTELYEAAHLDGTSKWQRFRYLTIPLLRPTILFAVVQAMIYNLQIFDTVFVMTDGGPANSTGTIVWYIYQTLFNYSNVGYGAALSTVLLIMILAMTLIIMRLLRGRKVN